MLDISEESHRDLYYDVDKCVEYCRQIKNTSLKEIIDFHMFWNVGLPFERKQILPIKSYLCTQDLTNTQLNVWSNVDLSHNDYLKPFLPYINLKIWDPVSQAKGTVLEGRLDVLLINDVLNYSAGDLFRILVLNNYGGLYVDFDVVFLRDFSPILEQEFMYKWSFQEEMINGAVMRMFKGSKLCKDLLVEISKGDVFSGTVNWSTTLYQKVRRFNKDWTIFPCAFFNTEWQIKLTEYQKKHDPEFKELVDFIVHPFKKTEWSQKLLYDGVFSWHWHNNWKAEIETGSKWQILEHKFNNEIKSKFDIQHL